MGKTKSSNSFEEYEMNLYDQIAERTGKKCETWLFPQVRATAYNMVALDKVYEKLIESMDAQFSEGGANLWVNYFDKLQRTLLLQYEALGINYKTTPKKINENTKKGGEEHDKLSVLMNDVKNA